MTEIAAKIAAAPALTELEANRFGSAIEAARPRLAQATKALTARYDLGPRGAWIIGLLTHGRLFPSDLTRRTGAGPSLITAEIARLEAAGLVVTMRNAGDGRRVEIELTEAGHQASAELAGEVTEIVRSRLAGYSRAEILACLALLEDFARD